MKKMSIFGLVILIILVFWRFFIPGPKVANDFPYIFSYSLKESFGLPSTWISKGGEGMGEPGVLTMWSWPVEFLWGIGGRLGLSFIILERLFVLVIIALGTYSIMKLLSEFKVYGMAAFVASLFYLTTTYLILLIDGGQLLIALAYSFLPLSFVLLVNATNGSLRQMLMAGLGVSILGFFDIRFVYVLFILAIIYISYGFAFLRRARLSWFWGLTKTVVVIALVFTGLNFYWILPLFLGESSFASSFERLTQYSSLNFTNLGHAIYLLQPHWYKNVFGKVTQLKSEFVFIPILVFLAPLLKKKSKEIGFWLLVSLVGVFLTKGANPPIGEVYRWLFTNIPGFSLFRDSTKFYFLISLSYSVLIGFTIDELVKRFNWRLKIGNLKLLFIPLIFTSYLLMLIRPVWLGKMTGTFSQPVYKEEFFTVVDTLRKDQEFGRVLWVPSRASLGYVSPKHPSVEATRLIEKRPFIIGTVGTYETFNFLREAPFVGELLEIAGVKYLSYPYPDTRREELKPDNIKYYYFFLDQLKSLPWVENQLTETPTPLLKVKKTKDHFFVAPNTFLIVGSDRIYSDLINIKGFDLSKNAVVFAEEASETLSIIKDGLCPTCKVILYDKSETDFAANLIDKSSFTFLSKDLNSDPNEYGWWKRDSNQLIEWRNFLQQKYGVDNLDFDYKGGWAVAEGERELVINNSKILKDNILLARVMQSNSGGKVQFYQGDQKVGEIQTKISDPEKTSIKLSGYKDIPDQIFNYDKANFGWFKIGKLNEDKNLTIKTEGDINVINALALVNKKEWVRLQNTAQGYDLFKWDQLSEKTKENIFAQSTEQVSLAYQRLTPTHYKVRISNLKQSATLAFSETFDSLWQINGQKSYPLYSLINGFFIDKDGEYDIYFSPQRHVFPGMVVSGVSLFVTISLLILIRRKKHETT